MQPGEQAISELEASFYNDGYALAEKYISEDCSTQAIIAGVEQMYTLLDEFISLFLSGSEQAGTPAHCRKGCAWCCHQPVYAETHTLLYLREHMVSHMDEATIDRVLTAAREKASAVAALDEAQRPRFRSPCPLLHDDACSAYNGRPMSCRIYLSYNVASCKADYTHPGVPGQFPSLFALPLRLGQKMNEGFAAYLQEKGREVKQYPMEEGLLWALGER